MDKAPRPNLVGLPKIDDQSSTIDKTKGKNRQNKKVLLLHST